VTSHSSSRTTTVEPGANVRPNPRPPLNRLVAPYDGL
jgi:hypothetical protein